MTDRPFDIVGFDLDGTLLDTSGDLAAACNHAIARVGRAAIAPEDIRPMIGGGTGQMLRRALAATGDVTDALVTELQPHLLAYYSDHIAVHTRPFRGLLGALDTLRSHGVALAVVSNKMERLCHRLLDTLDLSSRFACILGGDSLGPGRAKPAPDLIDAMRSRCGGGRAAFVGDSIFDVGAARAAAVPCIAVSFGFLDRPVAALGADAVIDHYDALIPALHALSASRE